MRYGRELILLLILCAVILIGSKYFKTAEGFSDVARAQHNQFVNRQQRNYNQVGLALLAGQSVGNLGTDTRPVLGTVVDRVLPSGNVRPQMTNDYPLNDDKEGLFGIIKKCEVVNTEDCNKFDDPNFAKDCGVCLDIGKDSNMKPKTGGLVVLERDRAYARKHKKRGNRLPEYAPTIGSCPANRLATTKAECLRIKKEKDCQNRKDYNLPECSQCFADGTYFPVTSDSITTKELYIGGVGTATVTYGGTTETMDLNSTPTALEIDVKEGETFSVRIDPRSWNERVRFYGYLQGTTQRGSFTIDLRRLVRVDSETGARVRTAGAINQFAIPLAIMSPGPGKRRMNLSIYVAMSFVDTDTIQGDMCPDGPFVTTRASAEFLDSDPCYKKGTGPGSYTMECLQETFIGNGCTESGRNFPNDGSRMSTLLFDERGAARTIGDIANMIYEKAVETATGMTVTAQKMEIEDWSASSVFCTGRAITSPCDTPDQDQGPLRPECLDHLWQNMGDGKQLGATFLIGNPARSLFRKTDRSQFCQREGTLAPIGIDGVPNPTAMAYWKGILGGVEPVKRRMREIHDLANGNHSDAVKAQAVMQCYGQQLADRPRVAPLKKCIKTCGTQARYITMKGPFGRRKFTQVDVIDSTGENVGNVEITGDTQNKRLDLGFERDIVRIVIYSVKESGGDPCGCEGYSSGGLRLYSQADCNALGGIRHGNGECTKPQGGSFSWDCRNLPSTLSCDRTNVNVKLFNNAGTEVADKVVTFRNHFDPVVVSFYTNTDADCARCDSSDNSNQLFLAAKDNSYLIRREHAADVCTALGSRQATYAEVQRAQKNGADMCFTGWVSDYGNAIYPITNQLQQGCGNGVPGIKEYTPPNQMAGVFCYGNKPLGDKYAGTASADHEMMIDDKNMGKTKITLKEFKPGFYNDPNYGPGSSY